MSPCTGGPVTQYAMSATSDHAAASPSGGSRNVARVVRAAILCAPTVIGGILARRPLLRPGLTREVPFCQAEGLDGHERPDLARRDVVERRMNAAPDPRQARLVRCVAVGGPLQRHVDARPVLEDEVLVLGCL